jgi:murein DD-endopeptidase MepM/ murein hydrolase activator NlpD/thiol-disulfide isomerase/thioredoxin
MCRIKFLAGAFLVVSVPPIAAAPPEPTLKPPMRTVDLNVGDSQEVELTDGSKATVELVHLEERRDSLRNAVRLARVKVEVNGKVATLTSANYFLPVTIGGVQVDCPVTKGCRENNSQTVAGQDPWGLDKDVRLRFWPARSVWINKGTFQYPARQRWFASSTQMANEPVYVDGGENPNNKKIYYHYGLDIGGTEGLVDVVAATDGLVVSSGKEVLPGYGDTPTKPRYDVVYILDARGWYYRYSHLHTIDPAIKPGARVTMGQKIGLLGKEGGSGGWSHLHFDISGRQPSGKWGIIEGYAFLWEAYLGEFKPKLLAVARPHHLVSVGEKVMLDGTRSWSADGKLKFDWTFTDGKTATGGAVDRTYAKPGVYSEVLKVTDGAGAVDYDFAVVNVVDPKRVGVLPPSIHAAYAPTFGIAPGDPVTFVVRTFRVGPGKEIWDFGDGTEKVEVRSDGNAVPLARDGYARTVHRYSKPGHYLVRVQRTETNGDVATAHLQVRVDAKPSAGQAVVLTPGDPASKLAPRYSPPGRQLSLESREYKDLDGFDHLETRLKLGPNSMTERGNLLVLARSEKGKPYDLLFVDADGSGKLPKKPITIRPTKNRNKLWSSFHANVRVNHAKPGADAVTEDYPVALWVVVEKEAETPEVIRVSRRGFLSGEIKLGSDKFDVVLSDSNTDGILGPGDWWELRGTAPRADAMRAVGDYAWAGGKAWMLELEGTNGRKGKLVLVDPGVTEAEDAVKRDRLREDRLAKRANKPVAFRKDVDAAIKEVTQKKAAYFIKFETDWCVPCKQMTELVFTAKDVVDAAEGLTCVIVDGDERKDLTEKYKVKGYPTGILFNKAGNEIARYVGYQSVKEMTAFFKKLKQ